MSWCCKDKGKPGETEYPKRPNLTDYAVVDRRRRTIYVDSILQCNRAPHKIVDRMKLMGHITLRKRELRDYQYNFGTKRGFKRLSTQQKKTKK